MSVVNITITDTYQVVGTGRATFTPKNIGGGVLLFSTSNANDDVSLPLSRVEGLASKQFIQTTNVTTYCRHTGATGEDWQIIADDNV